MILRKCDICGNEFQAKSSKAITCSPGCKQKRFRRLSGLSVDGLDLRNCVSCGTQYKPKKHKQSACSIACIRKIHNRKQAAIKNAKAIEGIENDVPRCLICGYAARALHGHVLQTHNLTVTQYKAQFNVDDSSLYHASYIDCLSARTSGELNPAFDHGGKFSAFSENFVNYKGLDDKSKSEKIMSLVERSNDTKDANSSYTVRKDYYLKQGLTDVEAASALSDRQTTFSLDICVERYGQEQGTNRWKARQQKWLSNYKKQNYSKISQDLFHELVKVIPNSTEAIFATCIDNGANNELILKCNKLYKLDFFYMGK
jgi:Zn ribbon nucleic-acid-binding protein